MKNTIIAERFALLLALALTVDFAQLGMAAEADQRTTKLCEDFEGPPRITFWSNNGLWRVNSAGPNAEKSTGGKRSFKIDVTWLDTSFDCWRPLPLYVLYQGNPKVGAKLLVTHGTVQLGHPYSTAESGRQGLIVNGRGLKAQEGLNSPWCQWQARGEGRPREDEFLSAAVLWARPDADGRTVVYIDDIQIEGDFPNGVKSGIGTRLRDIEEQQRASLAQEAEALASRFQTIVKRADAAKASLVRPTTPRLLQYAQRLADHCQKARSETLARISQIQKTPGVSDIRQAETALALLEDAEAARIGLSDYARLHPRVPFVTWIVEPIAGRYEKVLPKRFPVPGVVGTQLEVSACPGEYEPASFAVHAPQGLEKLTVTASDAKCGGHTIPASQINVRLVKCWWQAGVPIADLTHPTLTPELLLYDPDFVQVDDKNRRNTVRNPDAPRDADRLLPVDVPADSVQQYWITVHVPDDAAPGDYQGTIRLDSSQRNSPATDASSKKTSLDLPIRITVHPFRLEKPVLQYSVFYLGYLHGSDKPGIHNSRRSEAQYLAEMHNLKAHGITHPICYQSRGPLLDRAIELRKQAGLDVDPFYWLGYRPGAPTSAEDLESLKKDVRAAIEQVGKHGIRRLFIYGLDEATGDRLKSQREAFKAVHEAGASVFVACYTGAFELVGDLLDMALFSGPPSPAYSEKWHAAGHKIFNYGNPQSGVEIPEVYRRNYGLGLWRSGCDGAMDWAFTGSVGNVWNEYDHHKYRDIVFTYPTLDRPIDTIQWEGNREGIDDVRYLSTLLKRIELAKSCPDTRGPARQAEEWIAAIDPESDLNETRKQIVAWILRLDQADP